MSCYRVAHLTSVHSRYDTRVFHKECRSLAAVGYEVVLVVADGMGNERNGDVQIVDVGAPRGRMNRIVDTVQKIYSTALKLEADIYHLHDPELLRIAGKLRRTRRGAHVIYDSHEDVPRQVLSKPWIPVSLRHITSLAVEIIERNVVRQMSGVVAATPHIANRFRSINDCTIDVNNYPMTEELVPPQGHLYRIHKKKICYVGGIAKMRGLEPLLDAVAQVPDLTLIICGQFQDGSFERSLRALPGWSQVDYRGQLDRNGVRAAMAESSIGVVTLFPTPAYLYSLPVKMFEYMSAGLAVIASDFPLWRHIIEGGGAGLCVDPRSPRAIALAIKELLSDPIALDRMGSAGRQAVLERFNWPNEAEKLCNFYRAILEREGKK